MAFRSATILFAALVVAGSLVAVRADENGTAEVVPDPSICTPDVMNLATSMNDSCPTSMFKRSNYQACCQGLRAYYGVNSTEPTKNCFCNKDYYTYLTKTLTALQFQKAITYCNGHAKTEADEIYYYLKAGGPCTGEAWPAATSSTTTTDDDDDATVPLPHRSLARWIRELHNDTWGAIMFTVGIISFIGFALICWPFILGIILEIATVARKLANRKVD